ncbi:MAG: hypothetical protein ACYTEQ_14460, partial [Planctomycetota bacterium]
MTISNATNRTSAVGSGAPGQTVTVNIPVDASSDLVVKRRVTATGAETPLVEVTDYTIALIDGGASGGTLTTVTTIELTEEIHIYRDTPSTQTLDLERGGTFNAGHVEAALDRNTKLTIENQDALTRTMRIPQTDPTTINMELPTSIDRVGKYLTFDANGEPAVTVDKTTGTASVSAFGETLIDDANAAAARTTLGLGDIDLTVINVKNSAYGAVGNGTTDDTAAIQSAIDDVEAATDASMTIRGSGTLLHASPATSSLLLCNDTDEDGAIVNIEGLTFDGNGVTRKASAEVFTTTRADVYSTVASVELRINNCIFTNMRDKAIRICGPLRL